MMLQFSAKALNPPVSAKLSRNKFILYPLKIVEIKYKLILLSILEILLYLKFTIK